MNKVNGYNSDIYDLNNPIIKKLIKNSYLTHTQLEILLDYITRKQRGVRIKNVDDSITVGKKKIKRGTYYRILKSARNKIAKAILTMILITSLDIISHHDIISILERTSSLDITIENIEIYDHLIDMIKDSV